MAGLNTVGWGHCVVLICVVIVYLGEQIGPGDLLR